jgi:hypothetical protein
MYASATQKGRVELRKAPKLDIFAQIWPSNGSPGRWRRPFRLLSFFSSLLDATTWIVYDGDAWHEAARVKRKQIMAEEAWDKEHGLLLKRGRQGAHNGLDLVQFYSDTGEGPRVILKPHSRSEI